MNTDDKGANKIQEQITLTEIDPLSDWNVSCQILLIQRIHGQKRNFHFYGNHPGSLLLTFNFKPQKVFQLIWSWHDGKCTDLAQIKGEWIHTFLLFGCVVGAILHCLLWNRFYCSRKG